MPLIFQIFIRFIVLVAVQVFVLDNIQFLGYINPSLYILFILSLPVKFPKWIELLLAFLLGFIIDVFSNTLGINTFATVLVAFIRTPLINLFTNFDEGFNPTPSYKTFGVLNYIKYIVFSVLVLETALISLESFSIINVPSILLKIIMSSVVTIILILLLQTFKSK